VAVLTRGVLAPGRHVLPLARVGLASGVYFGRAVVTGPGVARTLAAKLVVLR
jgi:hypothetical protein